MTQSEIINSARKGLQNTKYPVKTLGIFYEELIEKDKRIYKIIAGLIKKFSPEIIFNAIIDVYDDVNNSYGKKYPLKYYCEVRFEQKKLAEQEIEIIIDLDNYIKNDLLGVSL